MTYVDAKGVGKPATFSCEPRQFGARAYELGTGVLSGMQAAERAQIQDAVIKKRGTDQRFLGRRHRTSWLYVLLAQMSDGMALDLVQNTPD